jgi:hypothetical protein
MTTSIYETNRGSLGLKIALENPWSEAQTESDHTIQSLGWRELRGIFERYPQSQTSPVGFIYTGSHLQEWLVGQ